MYFNNSKTDCLKLLSMNMFFHMYLLRHMFTHVIVIIMETTDKQMGMNFLNLWILKLEFVYST